MFVNPIQYSLDHIYPKKKIVSPAKNSRIDISTINQDLTKAARFREPLRSFGTRQPAEAFSEACHTFCKALQEVRIAEKTNSMAWI
jgi:hypothetical protein